MLFKLSRLLLPPACPHEECGSLQSTVCKEAQQRRSRPRQRRGWDVKLQGKDLAVTRARALGFNTRAPKHQRQHHCCSLGITKHLHLEPHIMASLLKRALEKSKPEAQFDDSLNPGPLLLLANAIGVVVLTYTASYRALNVRY